jgi:hypothetical protein
MTDPAFFLHLTMLLMAGGPQVEQINVLSMRLRSRAIRVLCPMELSTDEISVLGRLKLAGAGGK